MSSDANKSPAKGALSTLMMPGSSRIRKSAAISILSAFMWLPQAMAVAWGIGMMVENSGTFGEQVAIAAIFGTAGLLRVALNYVAGGFAAAGAREVIGQIRQDLTRGITERSPIGGQGSSAVVASLVSDKLQVIQPYIQGFEPAMARARIVPLGILIVMFYISWVAGLVFLVFGPLIPVFMAVIGIAAQKASEQQMERIASMNALLLDRLNALVDIRLLDALGWTLEGFEAEADDLRVKTMKVLRVAFLSSSILELFSAVGIALVAVFVGFTLMGYIDFGTYGKPLTVGEGVLLLLLAPEFFQPLRDFAAAWHDRASAKAVAEEVRSYLDADTPKLLGTGALGPPLKGHANISARNLRYQYGEGDKHIVPDFDIKAGENVALTGPSGSGKSSTLALLAGLFPALDGEITVCGQPLSNETADAWRARMAWVSQIPHFQNGSLRANVAPSRPADLSGITAALEHVHAADIVANADKGLDMPLGETGAGVSGGEARRILLARAAYAGRDVIFADEPTADLDKETAKRIIESLLDLGKTATLVIATHDPDLIARMDHSIRLGGAA